MKKLSDFVREWTAKNENKSEVYGLQWTVRNAIIDFATTWHWVDTDGYPEKDPRYDNMVSVEVIMCDYENRCHIGVWSFYGKQWETNTDDIFTPGQIKQWRLLWVE